MYKPQTLQRVSEEIKHTNGELVNQIEFFVKQDKLTYLEAMMQVCEEHEIEPEDLGKMINGPIKHKIELEARQTRGLKPIYCQKITSILSYWSL